MAIKVWIVATVMFMSFAFAVFSLTPVYYNIRSVLNATAVSIVKDPAALTTISGVVGIFGHIWSWVAALGAAFILIWAYVHSTKKDYESFENL